MNPYNGRQVDLEILQDIKIPSPFPQGVSISSVQKTPKMVTGIEKAIQRYAQLLLTTMGDLPFDQELGGPMVQAISQGAVSDQGYLAHLFCVASSNALRAMQNDDQDPTFGMTPDDETVTSASMVSGVVDYGTRTIAITVLLTTAAGNQYTFVAPVSTQG